MSSKGKGKAHQSGSKGSSHKGGGHSSESRGHGSGGGGGKDGRRQARSISPGEMIFEAQGLLSSLHDQYEGYQAEHDKLALETSRLSIHLNSLTSERRLLSDSAAVAQLSRKGQALSEFELGRRREQMDREIYKLDKSIHFLSASFR